MQDRTHHKVILIGGAPMVGKSTLARKLAGRFAYGCVSTDDLGQAIHAVTTAQSHPALHAMDGADYREYYITHSVDDLIADAELLHATLWPGIARVITAHATWGDPLVIEGWALYPSPVAKLALPNIGSLWLVADDDVLEARTRSAVDFYSGASDEEAMIQNFVARSKWYNRLIAQQATDLGLHIIRSSDSLSVDELILDCVSRIAHAGP
ncbi:MAG: hypothetical protein ACLQVD_10230 [Capsulimonadaceae bacterium]